MSYALVSMKLLLPSHDKRGAMGVTLVAVRSHGPNRRTPPPPLCGQEGSDRSWCSRGPGGGGEKTQSAAVLSNGDCELWAVMSLLFNADFILLQFFKCQKKKSTNPALHSRTISQTAVKFYFDCCTFAHSVLYRREGIKKTHKKIFSGSESAFFLALLTFNHTVATWLIVVNKLSK